MRRLAHVEFPVYDSVGADPLAPNAPTISVRSPGGWVFDWRDPFTTVATGAQGTVVSIVQQGAGTVQHGMSQAAQTAQHTVTQTTKTVQNVADNAAETTQVGIGAALIGLAILAAIAKG